MERERKRFERAVVRGYRSLDLRDVRGNPRVRRRMCELSRYRFSDTTDSVRVRARRR